MSWVNRNTIAAPILHLQRRSCRPRTIGAAWHLPGRGAAPGGLVAQLGPWGGPVPSFAARLAPCGRLCRPARRRAGRLPAEGAERGVMGPPLAPEDTSRDKTA